VSQLSTRQPGRKAISCVCLALLTLAGYFALMSLFAIGGANAAIPEMHRLAVDVPRLEDGHQLGSEPLEILGAPFLREEAGEIEGDQRGVEAHVPLQKLPLHLAEGGFGGWIFTYAVGLRLTNEPTAAYLTSTFWGALTLGRLLAIPLAARFSPRVVLLADLVGALCSVSLVLIGSHSLALTWLGAIALGLSLASIFPTTLALAERHMRITGQVTGWFFVGASLGAMFWPWLIGQLFEARSFSRIERMGFEQIVIVMIGALAGGFVSGLAGFGTGITALGIWLYALEPAVAATLVVLCSVVLSVSAQVAKPLTDDPELEKRLTNLASELRCLVCQNETLADSQADLAQDLRAQIREQTAADKDEARQGTIEPNEAGGNQHGHDIHGSRTDGQPRTERRENQHLEDQRQAQQFDIAQLKLHEVGELAAARERDGDRCHAEKTS